jgi:hypothetical protein
MATATITKIATSRRQRPLWKTAANLLESRGNAPPERVWLDPIPGTATFGKTQSVNGHDVLPGFRPSLHKLFARSKRR